MNPARLSAALLVLAAALPALAQEAAPSPPAAARVRLGTWNIENLGRRQPPRSEADVAAIASFIRAAEIDVLAVQEIDGPTPLQRLCRALGPDYRCLLGTTGTFKGGRISVGFVWDQRRIELLQAEELRALPSKTPDGEWIFHRKPVSAVFRARATGYDFRAVAVHLKAGRLREGADWERSVAKRLAEVGQLADHLEALLARAGEDQDLFVLGDFNSDASYPAHQAFAKRLRYLEPESKHRTIVYFDEQIDHVAVSAGAAEELVPGSLKIWSALYDRDPVAWKARYSDHIPLTVDLDASRDADPDASFSPPLADQVLQPLEQLPAEGR